MTSLLMMLKSILQTHSDQMQGLQTLQRVLVQVEDAQEVEVPPLPHLTVEVVLFLDTEEEQMPEVKSVNHLMEAQDLFQGEQELLLLLLLLQAVEALDSRPLDSSLLVESLLLVLGQEEMLERQEQDQLLDHPPTLDAPEDPTLVVQHVAQSVKEFLLPLTLAFVEIVGHPSERTLEEPEATQWHLADQEDLLEVPQPLEVLLLLLLLPHRHHHLPPLDLHLPLLLVRLLEDLVATFEKSWRQRRNVP